jgi:vitamin B12 transporter
MRRLLLPPILLQCALIPLAGHAQPTQLPDQVITATRVPTSIERLPASVTVIDRATIESRGYATLGEALAAVPGVAVVPSGGAGSQTSVFIRGSNSRHVLVLLDGQPMADPSEPNAAFNFGDDSLADIERIEVVRGPASVYYGSGAIGGVINLITRRAPRDRGFAPFGEVAAGTSRTVQGHAGAGGTVGPFDYVATAQAASTRGSNATADRIFPNAGEKDGARLAGLTTRLGYEPFSGTRVELLARRRETRIGLDDRPFGGGFDDPNYGGLNTRTTLRMSGETTLLDGLWTTGLAAGYSLDDRKFTNRPDALNASDTTDNFQGERRTFEWSNTVRPGGFGPIADPAVIFGIQRADEDVDAQSGSPSFRTITNARNGTTGFYLGAQTRVAAVLDVIAGVRQEQDEDFGGNTTWNIGGVLHVPGLPLPLRLRAAAGTSFKAPALFQRFGRIGTTFQGNPNLRPEKATSWEAGAETDLAAFGGTATLGVTYFESRIRDLIQFNQAFNSLENRERASIRGVETTLTLRPAPWLDAVASFTWLDARDRDTDQPLSRRPSHSGSFVANIRPIEKLTVTPQVTYAGSHREGAFATYLDDSSSLSTPANTKGATLLNLTVSYAVRDGLAVFLRGRNLTDRAYEPANSFQIAGRSVLAGVRASW